MTYNPAVPGQERLQAWGHRAEFDVRVAGGASPAGLRNLVEIYETSLADFRTTFVD